MTSSCSWQKTSSIAGSRSFPSRGKRITLLQLDLMNVPREDCCPSIYRRVCTKNSGNSTCRSATIYFTTENQQPTPAKLPIDHPSQSFCPHPPILPRFPPVLSIARMYQSTESNSPLSWNQFRVGLIRTRRSCNSPPIVVAATADACAHHGCR